MEYQIRSINRFDTPEADLLTRWWEMKTHSNKHLLSRTAQFLNNNLICAVAAYIGDRPIGAAGVIPMLDENGERVYYEGKLVVEFCSNFVHPLHQNKGIATEFIKMRTKYIENNNLFAISVTKQHHIVQIFQKLGWVSIDEYPEYSEIHKKVRYCGCIMSEEKTFIGVRCDTCPLLKKIVWIKKPN